MLSWSAHNNNTTVVLVCSQQQHDWTLTTPTSRADCQPVLQHTERKLSDIEPSKLVRGHSRPARPHIYCQYYYSSSAK